MSVIFYSSVKENILRRRLLWGLIPSMFGALLLLLAPVLLNEMFFQSWGWLIFLIGFLTLSFGLWPYKRLQKEITSPSRIEITEQGVLMTRKKEIPLSSIETIHYFESKFSYGMKMRLKKGDLIVLPFFSKRTTEEITDYISISEID